MKMKDWRELSAQQLTGRVLELEAELGAMREDVRTGKEKNHAQIKQLKREVARAKSAIKEKTN